jgi:anti-sigma regulatory factor (Ser/Thr protein kinase)
MVMLMCNRPKGTALMDAATYIRMMGCAMRRSLLDRMNIRLAFATVSLPLHSERCRRLGLIVHGLVTNTAKHACFEARTGEIRVKLTRTGALVSCVVLDNGSRSARGAAGRGLRIINDLANDLGGRVEHGFDNEFTSVVLSFPLAEREREASRSPPLQPRMCWASCCDPAILDGRRVSLALVSDAGVTADGYVREVSPAIDAKSSTIRAGARIADINYDGINQ